MKIPIVEMMANCQTKAHNPVKSYSDCHPLPASYMSEYSELHINWAKRPQALYLNIADG